MQATRSITLDVSQKYLLSPIFAKQVDDGTRFLKIQLTDNGVQIQPESGSTARFRGIKPDRHSFDNVSTINSDGTITVELTEQVLAVAGFVKCDVAIVKDEKTLASVNFAIEVQEIPMNGNMVISSNEFTYLQEQIKSSEAWAHGRSDFPERATDNSMYYTHVSEAWAKGRSDFPERENDNAKYYNKVSEAWAHGHEDFPERDYDNAKYWSDQARAAVGLALVDDATGLSYKLGVHDGNLYIEQILTS